MKAFIKPHVLLALLLLVTIKAAASPSPAFEGRKLYLSHCMVCHGIDGKGKGPLADKLDIKPEDLTSFVPTKTDIKLQNIITGDNRGSDRSAHTEISKFMPKWKTILDSSQLDSLTAYLRYLSSTTHSLPGDPELGYTIYQQYCSICHGKTGDGNGALSKLIGINPIDHTNPRKTEAMSNDKLAQSILNGKGNYMPGWRGILSRQEIDALVSYIRLLSQVWGKLEHGGLVIVINSPSLETDVALTHELLQDITCNSSSNLSDQGKSRADKLRKLFKSRGVRVDKALTSTDCLALETAQSAFGDTESVDYLTTNDQISDEVADKNLAQLEQQIGSFSGNGNLVIFAHQPTIDALSFQRLEKGYFLVLMPMGSDKYDEVGAYRLNY